MDRGRGDTADVAQAATPSPHQARGARGHSVLRQLQTPAHGASCLGGPSPGAPVWRQAPPCTQHPAPGGHIRACEASAGELRPEWTWPAPCWKGRL